jgi:bacteriorhodopsin
MQIVLVAHNLLRWAVLIFGLWAIFSAISGIVNKRNYTAADDKSNFFFMLSCDIQLLLGLILYFANSWFERLKDLGNNMKDAGNRFFTMEHGLLMIIAIILVHVGRVSVKKAPTSAAKHNRALIFFGLAVVLILAAIPWPFREAITRPLLRWFN